MRKYFILVMLSFVLSSPQAPASNLFTDPNETKKFWSNQKDFIASMHMLSKDELITKLAEGVKKHCDVYEQEVSLLSERLKIQGPPDLFQKSQILLELKTDSKTHKLSLAMVEIDTLPQRLKELNFKSPEISLMVFDLLHALNLEEFQIYHLTKLQGSPFKPCDAHSDPISAITHLRGSLCYHPDYRKSFEENTGFLETEFWQRTGKIEYLLLKGRDNVLPMGSYFKAFIEFDCKDSKELTSKIASLKLRALQEHASFLNFLLTAMGQEKKQNGSPLHESTSNSPTLLFVSVISNEPPTRKKLREKLEAKNATPIKLEAVTPSTPSPQSVQKEEKTDQPLVKEVLKDLPTEKQEDTKLLKENGNLRKRLIKSQTARNSLIDKQNQHIVEIETLKKKNSEQKSTFEKQKKALGTQIENLKQDLTTNQNDNATLSTQKKQLETQIAKLKQDLTKSQDDKATLTNQKNQTETKKNELQNQLATLKSKVEKERNDSAEKLANQQKQIEELLLKNSALEKKLVVQSNGSYGTHFINFPTLLEYAKQSFGPEVAAQLRDCVEKSMNNGVTQ